MVSVLLGVTFVSNAQVVKADEATNSVSASSSDVSSNSTTSSSSDSVTTNESSQVTNQPQDLNSSNLASASTYTLGDGNRRYPSADKIQTMLITTLLFKILVKDTYKQAAL